MVQVNPHPTLTLLHHLLPESNVSGGTFTDSMPHPSTLAEQDRIDLLQERRQQAVNWVVQDLLDSVGSDAEIPLKRGEAGQRIWPDGFTGSITHKGGVVLGVIAPLEIHKAIGIDVEILDQESVPLDWVTEEKQLPSHSNSDASVIAGFSVKESVYKAYHPLKSRELDYSDVTLKWTDDDGRYYHGNAKCDDSTCLNIQIGFNLPWITTTATL